MRRLGWMLFLGVYVLVAAAFLAGYAARHVQADALWWTELLAIGLPYLGLLLLPCTLVLAWARRWRLLGIHAVLLLLAALRMGPVLLPGRAADARPDDLVLLSYNVGNDAQGRPAEELAALVRREQPDVIVLQEALIAFYPQAPHVRARPYLRAVLDSLGYRTIAPQADGATYTPQPVLSRLPLRAQVQQEVAWSPGDSVQTKVTRTRLVWQGREVVLYNLHLHSFGSRKPWQEQEGAWWRPRVWAAYLRRYRAVFAQRAREAAAVRALLAREGGAVLVCGDLNSTPHNQVYARVAGGLQDAFGAAGQGWGMTYHARLPLVRIDYVFAGPAWEVVSARLPAGGGSDHRPLVVRLRWRR